MAVTLLAIHTFNSFTKFYQSFRTGPDSWTLSKVVFEGVFGSRSCSAGGITPDLVNKRGLISGTTVDGSIAFIGQGLPDDTPQVIAAAGTNYQVPDYWDMSHGAWWYDGAWWVMVWDRSGSNSSLAVLRSTTGATGTWSPVDGSNQPTSTGSSFNFAMRWYPSEGKVYVWGVSGSTNHAMSFWILDMSSGGSWGSPFGAVDLGRSIDVGRPQNGIVKFPNGDIGVFFSNGNFPRKTFYKLYAGGSWGSDIEIAPDDGGSGTLLANVCIDPSEELLHVFYYNSAHDIGHGMDTRLPVYETVEHDGTLDPDLFVFPEAVEGSDGVGHPIIKDGYLFVPFDDFSADPDSPDPDNPQHPSNRVWVMPLGTADFTAELLPRPTTGIDAPNPAGESVASCCFLLLGDFTPPAIGAADMLQYIKRHQAPGN